MRFNPLLSPLLRLEQSLWCQAAGAFIALSYRAFLHYPGPFGAVAMYGRKYASLSWAEKELFFAPRSPLDYLFAPIVVRDEPPNKLIVVFVQQIAGEGNAVERTPSRLARLLSNVGSE